MKEPAAKGEALFLQGLEKSFGPTQALAGVNLSVQKGDIYGFLGKNGAGKSTTIKIMAGLVRPDRGQVRIIGSDTRTAGHRARQGVGFLIENPVFHPGLSALDNLLAHGILLGRTRDAVLEKACLSSLDQVGLATAAQRKVGGFSTGMRQRLGLAQAFLGDPELIILDEPLNGLDPEGIVLIRELILAWSRSRGTTFFLSSHILSEVEQLCTRVGFVAEGRTVAEGTLEALGATGWLTFSVSDPGRAREILEAQVPEGEIRQKGEQDLLIRLPRSRIPGLVRELVAAGLDLFHVGESDRSLEELFLEHTRRKP